jgi:hypothetical protein
MLRPARGPAAWAGATGLRSTSSPGSDLGMSSCRLSRIPRLGLEELNLSTFLSF